MNLSEVKNDMPDIYFDPKYAKLYENVEQGTVERFVHKTNNGCVSNLFILREIPEVIDGIQYKDIVSPYGYGGPVIECCKDGKKSELLREYEDAFSKYCNENHIVSEFVRFHPIINNGLDFASIYNSQCIRNTVGTNLMLGEDPTQEEFSKSCRKRIRRALRDGVSYKVTEKPETIHSFKEIYYSTMDRNAASEYYYFTDEYFQQCLEYFRENIILVEALFEGKVIAAGFYFVWNKVIHIHLSGTLSEYLYLSPAYILRYAVTLWGKEHGYELIHHGGGRSNAEDDSLYLFKKQFGEQTSFDFYIGKKIWNLDAYNRLCENKKCNMNGDFFPAYRGV